MYKVFFIFFCITCLISCTEKRVDHNSTTQPQAEQPKELTQPSIVILGIAQDAGAPQIGCTKKCCKDLFEHPEDWEKVVSLGIIDPVVEKKYLLEATPDIKSQLRNLTRHTSFNSSDIPDGIFITHAHIGHYTGLMQLGKEAINAKNVPTYVMPRLKNYLTNDGPWSQLVSNQNVALRELSPDIKVTLTPDVKIEPFIVPHRDEYSETVGFKIFGPNKSAMFIPDIDKWSKWNKDIITEIASVDYAIVDATFYDGEEINNRDISEIPHPFIIESMDLFDKLSKEEKDKIYFIHLNHTNPALKKESDQAKLIEAKGYHIAQENTILPL